jgi:hypothetical protein
VEPTSVSAMPDNIHRRGTKRAVEREWDQGTCELVYGHVRGACSWGMFVGQVFAFWGLAK